MKKRILLSLLMLTILLSFTSVVVAQVPPGSIVDPTTGVVAIPSGPTTATSFFGVVKTGLNLVFTVLLIVSIIFILLAAIQFITGGPEGAKEARGKLMYAAVGIVVALIARGLPSVIQSLLPAQ